MRHDEFQKQEGRLFTPSFFILLSLVLIGGFLIAVRCVKGLGAVSNMSDGYPWGIWITYDVAIGTAMACGGYAMALLVYIRNRMRYHPLIRSCILTSMFGYGLAGFSVMVDLGRPWNFYNFFVPSQWQVNSVMFEVALCIMSYTTVLMIEFLPAILVSLETSDWRRLRATLNWIQLRMPVDQDKILGRAEQLRAAATWLRPRLDQALIFFIILGVTLPTMHQSSLGSMLLVAGTKLHPLWHTGCLPLLFLINCIYIGYAIAIIQLLLTAYAFKRPYDLDELSGVARIIPWLTAVWLTVAIADLTYRQQWEAAFRLDLYSGCFLAEFALIIAGSLLLLRREHRHSPRWLYVSAALIVLGGGLYRVNVYMIGFDPGQGWKYFPSLSEILVTVGIVALEILGYQVLVKLCPVLPRIKLPGRTSGSGQTRPRLRPATPSLQPTYPALNGSVSRSSLETV
ncbi:MAG TPA: Ni/Fe-hydrogenase cytochrome b subunit [Candidatus Paceibacterota bacterium]|nr:Ni/Fe-hydrogenase cytochrome b subunit [Verrucomicrobiota bacterium]HRY49325.1 Ni/Fe-hydrogenase cytochrome b subunit [Candidatus Paceibacterota bacterium]